MEPERKQKLTGAGINVDKALERFMGNENMLNKYLGRFLEEKSYAALAAAIASGDKEQAAMAAHTLKSVCGTLGFEKMQQMVVDQEAAMRAGNWEDAVARQPAIAAEYERICEVIRV